MDKEPRQHYGGSEISLVALCCNSRDFLRMLFITVALRPCLCALKIAFSEHSNSAASEFFEQYVLCQCPRLPSPDSYSFLFEFLLPRSCSGSLSLAPFIEHHSLPVT
ncbi:hypothetical protein H1C71_008160 [Ictidomys tridecemlineatus]|nr:hypothetical protein H1C71_008160 [Ictidomys tridecemlineatus]